MTTTYVTQFDNGHLPAKAGVYFVLNACYGVIYVGESEDLQNRHLEHDKEQSFKLHGAKYLAYHLTTADKGERLEYEKRAIIAYDPPLNTVHATGESNRRTRTIDMTTFFGSNASYSAIAGQGLQKPKRMSKTVSELWNAVVDDSFSEEEFAKWFSGKYGDKLNKAIWVTEQPKALTETISKKVDEMMQSIKSRLFSNHPWKDDHFVISNGGFSEFNKDLKKLKGDFYARTFILTGDKTFRFEVVKQFLVDQGFLSKKELFQHEFLLKFVGKLETYFRIRLLGRFSNANYITKMFTIMSFHLVCDNKLETLNPDSILDRYLYKNDGLVEIKTLMDQYIEEDKKLWEFKQEVVERIKNLDDDATIDDNIRSNLVSEICTGVGSRCLTELLQSLEEEGFLEQINQSRNFQFHKYRKKSQVELAA